MWHINSRDASLALGKAYYKQRVNKRTSIEGELLLIVEGQAH